MNMNVYRARERESQNLIFVWGWGIINNCLKIKSINRGKNVELAIQSRGISLRKRRTYQKSAAMSKDLRNQCKSDLSLNRRGREKELFPLARVNLKSMNSAEKEKNEPTCSTD